VEVLLDWIRHYYLGEFLAHGGIYHVGDPKVAQFLDVLRHGPNEDKIYIGAYDINQIRVFFAVDFMYLSI
jgi:hypothetical protein